MFSPSHTLPTLSLLPLPSFRFPSLSPCLEVTPQIQLSFFREALLVPPVCVCLCGVLTFLPDIPWSLIFHTEIPPPGNSSRKISPSPGRRRIFLVYLEPRERVWRLQMSFYIC